MSACARHKAEPVKGYHACPGCEVEALRAEVETLKAARLRPEDVEWSHSLQRNLMEQGKDQDHEVRQLMAEAACCLANLTGGPLRPADDAPPEEKE